MKGNHFKLFLFAAAALSSAASFAGTAIKGGDLTGTDLANPGTASVPTWSGGSGPLGSPSAADDATWNSLSLGAGLTVGADVSWRSISITGALADIAISGGAGKITTGNITLAGNRTLSIANGILLSGNSIFDIGDVTGTTAVDATLSGIISGSFGITKTGAGTLTLSGANAYSGGTTVSAGTLEITNTAALGTGLVTVTGGTLDLVKADGLTAAIALNGGAVTVKGCFGTVTIGGNSAITGGFESINSGTDASTAITTTGGLIVQSLTGQGTFSGGLVEIVSDHNPGGGSLGTQTFNAGLTYGFFSDVNLQIDSLGLNSDQIHVGGVLDIDLANINVSMFGTANYNSAFWDSNHSFALLTFVGLADGTTIPEPDLSGLGGDSSQGSWTSTQDGQSLNAVWTAVPEPDVALLGGLGLIGLLLRRRK